MPEIEPSLKDVLTGPNRAKWVAALDEEIRNTLRYKVFRAINRTRGIRPLGTRMVLRNKFNKEGKVEKRKARLVIRGFEQIEGIDFNQTFASVAQANTWRVLLLIAAILNWEVHQVDIVAAFLNGYLEEKITIEIPFGLEEFFAWYPKENTIGFDPKKDQVLEVLWSLYRLKQAPRQWQKVLKKALAKLGFIQLKSDNAIFIYYKLKIIIVIYVDDFLVMSPSLKAVKDFKKNLGTFFEVKDLGEVSYYLGVRITRDRAQRKIWLV